MKISVFISLLLLCIFTFSFTSAQNVSLNVLTQNAGTVNLGGTVFVEITLANTSSAVSVPVNKVRPQISVPISIVGIPVSGHVLPPGWSIISNAGGVLRLCNGSDAIPPNTARTILIAIQGYVLGGPLTISGNTTFANGTVCTTSGGATSGDVAGDNTSTSTIQVFDPIPVKLSEFNTALINCQPVLTWKTETEINSDRFEIEYKKTINGTWQMAGNVTAKGMSSSKVEYNFTDKNLFRDNERIFYRLKMIDKDGEFDYSEIKTITVNCKTADVYIYPNPVRNNKLNVILSGAGENIRATMVSVAGQVIFETMLNNGSNILKLPNITRGFYILNIASDSGFEKQLKVIVQD